MDVEGNSNLVPESYSFSQAEVTQAETQTQTQQQTQPSQFAHFPATLWGRLVLSAPPTDADRASSDYVERPQQVEMAWGEHGNECNVGRHPRSQLVLNGKKISSLHARLFAVQGEEGVRLEDLSTNGTFVRGAKVGKGKVTLLENGDEIIFGPATTFFSHDFRYIFHSPEGVQFPNDRTGIREKYDVREQIGKGSFATVRKGIQRSSGKMVAIKIIQKARFAANPKTMEMIQREVEIMKALDHEYCVRYIDYFEDDERMWLVLEYVDGGDLLDYVMKRHGLNEAETREIALMVCQAVAYLHSKGVAHRDLKPENLLLTKGTRPRCLVTDFGLAKMVDTNTMLKTCCGTPSYLAPEVILNANPAAGYGAAVDSWSLGVVLYSCLTNSTPFDESESTPLPQRMAERRVDFSHVREVGVSEVAIDFLSKLLLTDPTKRMSVQDSLRHPWLAGTSAEQAAPLLVSSLPFNAGLESASTAAASLTSPAISVQDSFGYSQRLDNLRLGTPGRSFASASQTTPDKTMDEDIYRPLNGSLGKRKEPASAFSSSSSIGQGSGDLGSSMVAMDLDSSVPTAPPALDDEGPEPESEDGGEREKRTPTRSQKAVTATVVERRRSTAADAMPDPNILGPMTRRRAKAARLA